MQNIALNDLTLKKIFYFWIPLSATWLMMAIEGPFLSALIARMPEPKYNLAAYGVAFSLAIIVEAPIIMMLSASTALVKDYFSFKKLRNFTYLLNYAITGIMLLLIIPPVFTFVAEGLIGLPTKVAHLTHIAVIILLPWPGMIGYRRFYQGILIKNDLTRRVAYGTVIRLVSMGITGALFYFYANVDGVIVGAAALSVGVTAEGIATKLMSLGTLRKLYDTMPETDTEPNMTYKSISVFYYPLALTSLLTMGVHPLVTFFMGQSRMSLESLAVLPVINSLAFIFRSFGLSFQEVGIALMGENREGLPMLKKFGFLVGGSAMAMLMLVAFTPIGHFYFHSVAGLSLSLTEFSRLPLQIMSVIPGLTFWISFQRSLLVHAKRTNPITIGTGIEVSGIILTLFISIPLLDMAGAVAATTAFILGRIAANMFLHVKVVQTLRT